jgi:hypothetical protein
VIYVVSLPVYVKDAHFFVLVLVCPFERVVWCLMVGGLCVWIGNPLFEMMCRLVFTSSFYSSSCRWYVLACCVEILWLRICIGLGGLRSTG